MEKRKHIVILAAGDFPDDPALLRPLAENVCYRNAKAMIGGRA